MNDHLEVYRGLQAFPNRLAKAITEAGLSTADLSKKMEHSKTAILSWRNGTTRPRIDALLKLCVVLKKDPNWFLGWKA